MSTIFYFFSLLFCVIGCFFVKKSKKELNFVCHIFISLYLVMCYQVMAACILSFFFMEISIVTIGITNFILGVICSIYILNNKEIQKYRVWIVDIIAMLVFVVLALFWGMHQFGVSLDLFNYRSTIDCTRHLLYAREFATKHSVTNIPFMAINTGLWFEAVYPFMHPYNDFRLIIRTDIVMVFLSSIMFWGLIRNHLKIRKHLMFGIIATILYTSGFPVNNMVFGTSYLGAGVTCTILVYKLICMYQERELQFSFFCSALFVSMFGLLKAYPLFFPIIFISLIVFFTYNMFYKRYGNYRWMKLIIPLMAIACAICVIIIFEIMPFGSPTINDLTREGYIYRNLFSDFVFLIPFVLYRIYQCVQKGEVKFDYVMSLFLGLYTCALLVVTYIAKMSTYYYYKIYYLLWMTVFYTAVMVIVTLGNEALRVIHSIFITICMIAFYSIMGIENRIQSVTENRGFKINENVAISDFLCLYNWNYYWGDKKNMCISPDTQELFQKVAQLTEGEDMPTPYIGLYRYHQFCYYTMAYQWEEECEKFACMDSENFIKTVRNDCRYMCLLYEEADQAPWDINDYLDTLKVEYKNDAGIIYRVK